MSNGPTNSIPKGNGLGGLGGVLTTLASSGDNWVKMLIVGGIILNTVMTKNNSSNIKTNDNHIQNNTTEIDKFRRIAAQELRVLYDNQRVFADFMDETRQGLDRVQTKLQIEHPPFAPYPRQEMPDLDQQYR